MRQKIIYFLIFLILFTFVFRSLFLNLSTALMDWRDYASMVWTIFQNMTKISTLNFHNYFYTTSFYPHPYSLLFADLLLPQSILALPFYLLTGNLILSFNITFIITFILNYISTFIFWKQIFKKDSLAFFGSLLIIFSPFFHLEGSHFQMMSYWPFFFSLYFLFRTGDEKNISKSILCGIFLSIQFLSSVYLSVYLLVVIGFYYLIKLLNIKTLKASLINLSIISVVFLLICGVFMKGYFDMRKTYNIKRDIKEYITYSANLSDYIFTSPINSIIHQSAVMKKWNSANKSSWGGHASFPGFLTFFLSLLGLFIFIRNKKTVSLILNFDKEKAFFFIISLTGFIFSLGPRLVFNGTYAHIPLPYALMLKFIPLFQSTRVSARWSFLFFLGLTFFALTGLNKIINSKRISPSNKLRNLVFISCFVIFILEYIPFNLTISVQSYYDYRDAILKNLCAEQKQVVLELPVTHLNADTNIADGLSYITKRQLASTYNGCFLINGYSGYDLPENFELAARIDQEIDSNNPQQFVADLKLKGINLVKFNPDHFIPLRQPALEVFLKSLEGVKGLKKIETTMFIVNPD